MNLNKFAYLYLFPFSFENADFGNNLNFTPVLLLIAFVASQILNKVFKHRHSDDNRQRNKHGRFSFTNRDWRNDLKYSDQ